MTGLSILFRTDASLDIGTGHVMRCLTLAEALRERGALCRFVCRIHPGNLIELIRQRGFEVLALPFDGKWVGADDANPLHAAWLGADWATDAEQTKVGAGDTAVDWLIVDHYALDARWERALRMACRKLMAIDDLADRPHDCDLLLDQNLGRLADDYSGLVPGECELLVGPKYALLRPEFAALREYSLRRRATPRLKRLLISLGGVDKDNVTGEVLDALKCCTLPENCRITVVIGPHAPWLEQVRATAGQLRWETEVLVDVQNMAELMADSDFAIGAAGCTSWERCTMGLPSLLVVLARNQVDVARYLSKAGAAECLDCSARLQRQLCARLTSLAVGSEALAKFSLKARSVCDGAGASRVVEKL